MYKQIRYFSILTRGGGSLYPTEAGVYNHNKNYTNLLSMLVPDAEPTYRDNAADSLLFLLSISSQDIFKYDEYFPAQGVFQINAQFQIQEGSGRCLYQPEKHTEPYLKFDTKLQITGENTFIIEKGINPRAGKYDLETGIDLGCGCLFMPRTTDPQTVRISADLPCVTPDYARLLKDISPRYLREAEINELDTVVEQIAALVARVLKECGNVQ
jgi:hypothetical protein